MILNQMPSETARTILNMIAYGCVGRDGFNYELLLCRTRKLLPASEQLVEFRPTADYLAFTGDDIDHAALKAARRLCGSNQ